MKRTLLLSIVVFISITGLVSADSFGTGENQFDIDFVTISGDASSANGTSIGYAKTFNDPSNDYRMGTYEITNDQWNKFKNAYGTVTGTPSNAYDQSPYFPDSSVPTNGASWYEAAQFVNWLNTSNGKSAAYKFAGTQGTSDYTLGVWSASDAGYNAANPYRNSNAIYFLPTDDEWVKAAYWNGTSLQTYATIGDVTPTQAGWNFWDDGYATDPYGPWNVGSGSQELNGTYDMMGNVFEWMESPYYSGDYLSGSFRGRRGGSCNGSDYALRSSYRYDLYPHFEGDVVGFRVASVPEPATLLLLSFGGLLIRKR